MWESLCELGYLQAEISPQAITSITFAGIGIYWRTINNCDLLLSLVGTHSH